MENLLADKTGARNPEYFRGDVFLNEAEWQVLWAYVKKQAPPAKPPPIGQITQ